MKRRVIFFLSFTFIGICFVGIQGEGLNPGPSEAGLLNNAINGDADGNVLVAGKTLKRDPQKSFRGQAPKQGNLESTELKLAEEPSCKPDIKRFCKDKAKKDVSKMSNFAVLGCLLDVEGAHQELDEDCQHLIWQYRDKLTKDTRFDNAAHQVCETDLKKLAECSGSPAGTGLLVSCLIEHRSDIKDDTCGRFLDRMAGVVFGDYRLIFRFNDHCQESIKKTNCGRAENKEEGAHSQGETVACLTKNFQKVDDDCKKQILRVAELQSDDYHYDRALYFACYEDRERFCGKTKSGNGRVYKCLMRHATERLMGEPCREKLRTREKLMQHDYKVDKGLQSSCSVDVKKYDCAKAADGSELPEAKLVLILQCLQSHIQDGDGVTPECQAEMQRVAKMMMEDYSISPHVVADCHAAIMELCGGGLKKNGETLHCLMAQAKPYFKKDPAHKPKNKEEIEIVKMDAKCIRSLEQLIDVARPQDDWHIDPLLVEACQSVVETECKGIKAGKGRVVQCLMSLVGGDRIEDECETRLLEVQYFAVREWRLTHSLYRACHSDAVDKCHAPKQWHKAGDTNPTQGPLIFSCLYRHLRMMEGFDEETEQGDQVHDNDGNEEDKLKPECAVAVRDELRRRAVSVDLNPELEQDCMKDLAYYCSEEIKKGSEMQCLQDHLEDLETDCKEQVQDFTKQESVDINLDVVLMRACLPSARKYCNDYMDDKKLDNEALIQCMIENKDAPEMDVKCRAGIEHHQLVMLKEDIHFSHRFKEACKKDAVDLCAEAKTKAEVVECLSGIARKDVLSDAVEMRVSPACRQQLHAELLQRDSSIDLDPDLKKACKEDIGRHCGNVAAGQAHVINCLKKHQEKISRQCGKILLKREEVEAVDPRADYAFVKECKTMIKTYCKNEKGPKLLRCLKSVMDEPEFDEDCREEINKKLNVKARDWRLNPELQRACRKDVKKYCMDDVQKFVKEHQIGGGQDDAEDAQGSLEGIVLSCLRHAYISKKKPLSAQCQVHVKDFIHDAAVDYRRNPVLGHLCQKEIGRLCSPEMEDMNAGQGSPGEVEECLKAHLIKDERFFSAQCKSEVAQLIMEGEPDIHVDQLLYQACSLDLKHHCNNVVLGEGRQMSCLLEVLDDAKVEMTPKCRETLIQRKVMWEYAAKVAPPGSVNEALQQLSESPVRHYLLAILSTIVGVIFIMGLTCGRVTKRITRLAKDK